MGHAVDLGYAPIEAGLVAGKVVTDQLATPVAEEGTSLLAGTAGAEVIDHALQVGEGTGRVGPGIVALGFLHARGEHLHRRFVG